MGSEMCIRDRSRCGSARDCRATRCQPVGRDASSVDLVPECIQPPTLGQGDDHMNPTKSVPAATGEIATGKYGTAASSAGYNNKSTTTSPNLQAPAKNPRQVRSLAVPLYVPSDLETVPQWVCWSYEVRKGKVTKPPIDVHTGGYAETDNPSTWATFETAETYYHEHPTYVSGVGLVVAGTDLAWPVVPVLDKVPSTEHGHTDATNDVEALGELFVACLLYTSPSPRDGLLSRMPSSA